MDNVISREQCIVLDGNDPLSFTRERFSLPQDVIYLDGNSLGPLPAAAESHLQEVIGGQWGRDLIQSWNRHGWFELPVTLGDRLGRFIGAGRGQVVVCDTTSVNVYKVVRAALELRPERSVVIARHDDFPTDLYVIEGALSGAGRPVSRRYWDGDPDTLGSLVDDKVAVIVLSHVHYASGEILPMEAITRMAHEAGALVIWDLCHSVGVMPIELDRCNVDFAVGCTYKYLNCGPGAPAFVYVNHEHLDRARQPLSGWWGHDRPFDFAPDYTPHAGISRFLCGTQPILSMQAVACGLDTCRDVSLQQVRDKAMGLTELFVHLVESRCSDYPLELASPKDPTRRGSHVSYAFAQAYPVVQAMIEKGVIGDFRAPDLMRFGFSPLYIRSVDVWDAVDTLFACLRDRVWLQTRFQGKSTVT